MKYFFIVIVGAILLSCSQKEKEFNDNIDYIIQYCDKLEALNREHNRLLYQSLNTCYNRGVESQTLIKSCNSIDTVTLASFEQLKQISDSDNSVTDSLRKQTYKAFIRSILPLIEDTIRYLSKHDEQYLLHYIDSCISVRKDLMPKMFLAVSKLEILTVRNRIKEVISQSCGRLSTHCGWDPFANSVEIKSYSKNDIPYLEVKFPWYVNAAVTGISDQRSEVYNATQVRIIYVHEMNPKDSCHFIVDLSNLKKGNYHLGTVFNIENPKSVIDSLPITRASYYKYIDFEVYK